MPWGCGPKVIGPASVVPKTLLIWACGKTERSDSWSAAETGGHWGKVRVPQQLVFPQHDGQNRRHGGNRGATIAADRVNISGGCETGQQDDGIVLRQRGVGGRQPIHVVERRRDQHALPRI